MKLFPRKNRIYIFPTKMGGYLIGLLFLMFLLSVGYSNNLLLIFTLFLFGFNLLWLIQTHFHLQALKLASVEIPDAHVNEDAVLRVSWRKSPAQQLEWDLELVSKELKAKIEAAGHLEFSSQGIFKIHRRGKQSFKFLKVSSIMPYGLYKAWVYFEVNQESYGYPQLLKNYRLLDLKMNSRDGEIPEDRSGVNDIRHLAPYQGEEFRRISWKHYASRGELLIKEGEEHHSPLWTHRLKIPENSKAKELYLSEVATQMVHCFRNQIPFLFHTDTRSFGPSLDETHLRDCLKVLSLC